MWGNGGGNGPCWIPGWGRQLCGEKRSGKRVEEREEERGGEREEVRWGGVRWDRGEVREREREREREERPRERLFFV